MLNIAVNWGDSSQTNFVSMSRVRENWTGSKETISDYLFLDIRGLVGSYQSHSNGKLHRSLKLISHVVQIKWQERGKFSHSIVSFAFSNYKLSLSY
jgi:hypothetical protein